MPEMKVAIVHYWLVGMRGGEKVLEALCELYPDADIYTHVAVPENLTDRIRKHKIVETWIARLPLARKFYQKYLPLMPLALESLDLSEYDLVISSEAGPAKGVITSPDSLHICYCHSPMRYIWDQYPVYREQAGFLTRLVMPLLFHYLRIWDVASAARVDDFIANSHFIKRRIAKVYARDASVIYPPIDISDFGGEDAEISDFYLYAGELVSYKRPDLVIEAFNKSGKKLVVIGGGSEKRKLEKSSKNNITFLGRVEFDVLKLHYSTCKALIFPGVEDFGIIPLEVMASGRPVIAYAKGGALETVIDGVTGVLFESQNVASLEEAISRFESDAKKFEKTVLERHAQKYSKSIFKETFGRFISDAVSHRFKNRLFF